MSRSLSVSANRVQAVLRELEAAGGAGRARAARLVGGWSRMRGAVGAVMASPGLSLLARSPHGRPDTQPT